jgi:hypothetical protein
MDRRGFLGGLAAVVGAVAIGRTDRLVADDAWDIADIPGVLTATPDNVMDYKITVDGRMPTDCLRACPAEGWYEVAVHRDGKDDFDPDGVVMLTEAGDDFVRATRTGPVVVWKRRK